MIFDNEYIVAVLILLAFIALAKLADFVMKKVVMGMAKKTKTDLDDKLVIVATPIIYTIMIFSGVYLSLMALSILNPYVLIIRGIFFVIGSFILALAATKVIRVMVLHWLHVQKRFEKTPQLIVKIINVVIYSIAALIVLDHFNISITPLMATLGVGAVAVGLALQGTLSNLFAGVRVISDRKINIGDFVELDSKVSGYVEDISWSTTTIHTLSNTLVVVPNSKIAETIVTNYSLPQAETSVTVDCGVSYKSNLDKVERVTVDVAEKIQKNVKGAVKNFKPFIRFNEFGDSNIKFSVILRAENVTDKYLIRHEFMKELKKRYDREKIEISFPMVKIAKR